MTMPSRFPRVPVLSPEINARVQDELQPGERLVWAEQPRPGAYARESWAVTLFGIPFTAFAVFWISMSASMTWGALNEPATKTSGPRWLLACFPLFGLPFLAIGLGMMLAPLWARRAARHTVYALTDRRAIIWSGGAFGSVEVRSFGPDELGELTRIERSDGCGDLVFREYVSSTYAGRGRRSRRRTRAGFIGVERVRQVEDLLRQTLLPDGQA